jgi:hypothetical protein
MATALTFRCAPHVGLIPVDEEGAAYLAKRPGQHVEVKVSQPRSLEQNAKLWAVATTCFETLPEKWEGVWGDKYRMVKGLQLALGIVDEIAVPTKNGTEIQRHASSIAEMDREEANAACDLLFRGMAKLLGVSVETLLNETERRT